MYVCLFWASIGKATAGLLRRFRLLPPEATRLGRQGENAACRFLKRQGFRIVTRRLRNRLGEIDIIAIERRTNTLVFVEVKARRSAEHGGPVGAVTAVKQERISRAARVFLKRHGLSDVPARFDVVTVVFPDNGKPEIEHYRNAFHVSE